MPPWLYQSGPNGLWIFLLLTVLLGGGAAFISGKSVAETWRPVMQLPIYMLLLAAGVRFLHFALFEEPFLAPMSFLVDFLLLSCCAGAGYRLARSRQMAMQYGSVPR